MTRDERRAIADNGVRWATNMLVEILGNHGTVLSPQDALREAVTTISRYGEPDRKVHAPDEAATKTKTDPAERDRSSPGR